MLVKKAAIAKLYSPKVCFKHRIIDTSHQFSTNSSNKTRSLLASYNSLDLDKRQELLTNYFIPNHQTLLNDLALSKGSIQFSMKLREDLIELREQIPSTDSKALDEVLKGFLSSTFCPDALELRKIAFESSSGNILESVARGEAVHRVRSLSELKRRLHNGRRCYAYFHHSMPNSPLAFIHISLSKVLAESMR
jgi:hypothetical protein